MGFVTMENLVGPGSPSSLRVANQKRVLAAIIDAGWISQAEISRRTGLAPATVSNIVRELTEAEILRLAEAASGRRGNTIAFAPDTDIPDIAAFFIENCANVSNRTVNI